MGGEVAGASLSSRLSLEFERAAVLAGGEVDLGFSISGRQVAVRCAGAALANELAPALAYPMTGRPDLVIHRWSNGDPPVPDGPLQMVGPWSLPRHCVEVKSAPDGTPVVVRGLVTGSEGVHWTSDGPPLPLHERAAPFLPLLNQWMAGGQPRLVHAGAVGWHGRGVLLAGEGGSGKSSTALACVRCGFDYVGDDYVAVDTERLSAHAVYRSGKLHWRGLHRVGDLPLVAARRLPPRRGSYEEEKAVFLMETQTMTDDLVLAAIILPRVEAGERTRLVPAPRVRALAALAPSTILQLPGSGQGDLHALRRLCESVPAYSLELGSDMETAPALLQELVSR
jgi:hypothetical protein